MFYICDYNLKTDEYGVLDTEDLAITYVNRQVLANQIETTGVYVFGYNKRLKQFDFQKKRVDFEDVDFFELADKFCEFIGITDYEVLTNCENLQVNFLSHFFFIYLQGIGIIFHFIGDDDELIFSTFSDDKIDFVRKLKEFSQNWRYRIKEYV